MDRHSTPVQGLLPQNYNSIENSHDLNDTKEQPEASRIESQPRNTKEPPNEQACGQKNENEHETRQQDPQSRETSGASMVATDEPQHEERMTRQIIINTISQF